MLAITTTYKCNEWLDNADLKVFEKMRVNNPRRYAIEGEGHWGIAEGLIYDNTELAPFDADEIRQRPHIKSAYGLDFGYTDPTAFVASMVDEDEGIIYVFDEFYKSGLTNQKLADEIMRLGYGGERIIADSAEPKSIQELRDCGLRVDKSRKGSDSVLYGIQKIQNYKIVVHPRCVETWREITNYCWEKDKFGRPMDKPEHEFSHAMDALRYSMVKLLSGNSFSFE